jgi:ABC-type phosphate/phosphonate transport system substrate-binding protein
MNYQNHFNRRQLLGAASVGAAGLIGLSAKAADPLLFAVNEGVTYRNNPLETQERFQPITEDLSKLLKTPVKIVAVARYDELQKGLAEQRYALAYVHPAHHAIRAMVSSSYRLAALTKGFTEYRASFFVAKGSPVKTLADLKGKKLGAPDEDSITSVILKATLRDAGLTTEAPVTYVRYQDAVPFMVEHGLVTAGVTASKSVLKEWQDKGGNVVASSKPVPIKHMLVSSKVPAGALEKVSEYFTTLEQARDGKSRIEAMRVQGFVPFDEAPMKAIGKWLGVA